MKVLILGIDGMIGHKIAHSLNQDYDLYGSSRKDIDIKDLKISNGKIVYHDFLFHNLEKLLKNIYPDVIINCIGITTRRGVLDSISNTQFLNSKLPHILDNWSKKNNSKLIHLSTDCVFSGITGNYNDDSIPDASDIYGLSKAKGEVKNSSSLTLRCSMIGREVYNFTELFEWLFSMKGKSLEGYNKVLYSGITTVRMGKIIKSIIKNHISMSGIYNISSVPISKFDLLKKLSKAFELNIDIKENPNIVSNKILISKKFTEITGINTPNWDDLILEFKKDCKTYKSIYKN